MRLPKLIRPFFTGSASDATESKDNLQHPSGIVSGNPSANIVVPKAQLDPDSAAVLGGRMGQSTNASAGAARYGAERPSDSGGAGLEDLQVESQLAKELISSRGVSRTEVRERFESAMRIHVQGHGHAVGRLTEIMTDRAMRDPRIVVPAHIDLVGTGDFAKTQAVAAIAEALHGDPKKFLRIDCSQFHHPVDLMSVTGTPPGYVGSGQCSDRSPLSLKNIETKVGKERPLLILWEGLDTLSAENHRLLIPELTHFMLTGEYRFLDPNCPTLKEPNVVNFTASSSAVNMSSKHPISNSTVCFGARPNIGPESASEEMARGLAERLRKGMSSSNLRGHLSLTADDLLTWREVVREAPEAIRAPMLERLADLSATIVRGGDGRGDELDKGSNCSAGRHPFMISVAIVQLYSLALELGLDREVTTAAFEGRKVAVDYYFNAAPLPRTNRMGWSNGRSGRRMFRKLVDDTKELAK